MLIKDPWGKKHYVNNNYDNKELVIPSTGQIFDEMVPEDILSRDSFNWNSTSTKINEDRAVTLIIEGPNYRGDGTPINSKKKTNW